MSEDGKNEEAKREGVVEQRSNAFRIMMLVACIGAIIYLVANNMDTFGNVLLTFLGFGTVILVHEFGHFIVAKLSDIEVEMFSIFMGPTLLGIKRTEKGFRVRVLPGFLHPRNEEDDGSVARMTLGGPRKAGETEYQVRMIPFGGFVKMVGQEDMGAAEATENPRSFANKPIRTRIAVIAAGVTFNAISAVIIFMTAFLIGIDRVPPIVGGVTPGSPAAEAGIRGGDEVIKIDGKTKNLEFSNIMIAAALSDVNEAVPMTIKHADGSIEEIELVAQDLQVPGMPVRLFGMEQPRTLTIGNVSDVEKMTEATGLLPGDKVVAVNGEPVGTYWEYQDKLNKDLTEGYLRENVTLTVERKDEGGDVETVSAQIRVDLSATLGQTGEKEEEESNLSHIYYMVPRLQIAEYSAPPEPKSFLEKIKGLFASEKKDEGDKALHKGDVILRIDDVENPTYLDLREAAKSHAGEELEVEVLRSDPNGTTQRVTAMVVPRKGRGDRVVIGVYPILDAGRPVVAKSFEDKVDIPSGATVTAVNGMAVSDFYDIAAQIGEADSQEVRISYVDAEGKTGEAALAYENADEALRVNKTLEAMVPFEPYERLYKASGPVEAIAMGWRKTVSFIAQSYATFKSLFAGLVSPKQLMGPVGILAMSYKMVAERPIIYYVYFLGLINAVIAVFNFLPILPLDGGLVVMMLIEKVRGKALSERTQTILTNTAWVLILSLFVYVTFNDVVRTFFS